MFLSNEQLEQLTGYRSNQRKRIRHWLQNHGIPFRTNRLGNPVVLCRDVELSDRVSTSPNLDWLKA